MTNNTTKQSETLDQRQNGGEIEPGVEAQTAAPAISLILTPRITSFSPSSGPTNTVVQIFGSGFSNVTSVRFNGVSASFDIFSTQQIQASVPAGALSGPISVSSAFGTGTSQLPFIVSSGAPTISSFTPGSGASGVSVLISGANFDGATAVRFNGVSAAFTVNSATTISATVPAGATSGPISVTTPDGSASSASAFTVTSQATGAQLTGNPRGLRQAHLAGDPVAGRLDYIFRNGGQNGGQASITAYAPGDQQLFSIPASSLQPLQNLIDVVDLDGDGSAEMVGIFGGSTTVAPTLYIYNGNGTLRKKFDFPLGSSLSAGAVKVYDVAGGQKRIVVAPNTFSTLNTSPISVYFFAANGSLLAAPVVPTGPGETLTFPAVMVGDIDGAGGNEIVVIAKSRLLVFNQDGGKLFYSQFVDSNGSFTSYGADNDKPVASGTQAWQGRRYGMYKLIDVDGDGRLELVVAADANNVSTIIPGAVYEAYDLDFPRADGYLAFKWRTPLQRSARTFNPSGLPSGYTIGVPINGIDDINGDGIPEIVVTELAASGSAVVKIINARTGAISNTGINGICLDVRRLSANLAVKDLIVYQPATRTHSVWRFSQPGTFTLSQLANPDQTLTSGAITLVQRDYPEHFATDPAVSESTLGHFSVMLTRSGGTRAFVGYSAASFVTNGDGTLGQACPIGLRAWSAAGTAVQSSLAAVPRPGRLVGVLDGVDQANHRLVLEIESACQQGTNLVKTFVQQGVTLAPTGEL